MQRSSRLTTLTCGTNYCPYLDETRMCGPAVNDTPDHVARHATCTVVAENGIETAASGGTAVLGILCEGHSSLNSISLTSTNK